MTSSRIIITRLPPLANPEKEGKGFPIAGNPHFPYTPRLMQRKSRAIILRRVGFGEADWIVTFFCRERGRLSGIARSARSSRRRFAGALEPGAIVDLRYAERGGSGLLRLEESVVAEPLPGILRSLERIQSMLRALSLALAFLQEGEANPRKFDLLAGRLRELSEREPSLPDGLVFEMAWLTHSGFAPQIAYCAACQAPHHGTGRWCFDVDRGGLLCGRCALPGSTRLRITPESAAGFAALATGVACEPAQARAAGEVLSRYIDHVVGRPLAVR